MREGKRKQWVPPYVSHIARTGQFQAFSVLRGPESFGRQNVPVCPGPGPGRWVRGPGSGRLSENSGLAGGLSFLLSSLLPGPRLGQPLAYPESTEGRPWGQPLKKLEGAPVNLG